MLFLIGTFSVVSPIIIFYAMGFRYDLKSGIIRTTGVISVNVEPRDARVSINGSAINKKMPLRISNRAPGTYTIRIEKEGYKTWEKEIRVESNQTTYLNSFELLKDAPALPMQAPESSIELYALPVTENILAISEIPTAGSSSFRLSIFDQKKQNFEELHDYSKKPEISLSPFHETALIIEKNNTKNSLELFDAKSYERKTRISFPALKPLSYQWSKKSGELYLRIGDAIGRLEPGAAYREITSVSSSASIWYVEYPQTIWLIENSTLFLEQKPDIAYSVPAHTEKILDINKDRILLQTKDGVTVINRNTGDNAVTQIPGKGWYYNHFSEEWWFWSDWELWSVYKDGSLQLLNREAKKLKQVLPMDEKGLKLLVHSEDAEVFNPAVSPSVALFKRENLEQVFAMPKYKTIYFMTTKNGVKEMFKLPY